MSVWVCVPAKRAEAESTLPLWQKQGYKIAIAREPGDGPLQCAQMRVEVHEYLGWARSTNLLVAAVMATHADAEWFIAGGDDIAPDLNHTADEIAAQCNDHFARLLPSETDIPGGGGYNPTFGVMQPTGDRWGDHGDGKGAVIDRIAGSPWMGREFCRRMYHGAGPLYNGYYHNFADEELQCVAQKLGVFWQRRDLIHEHRHWARPRGNVLDMPEWARKINDPAHSDWDKSKALFAARKAAGFPGHEPLEL